MRVVHGLEVVQVHEKQRDPLPRARRARERAPEVILQHGPVRQPRELIVVRQIREPLLDALALHRVADRSKHSRSIESALEQVVLRPRLDSTKGLGLVLRGRHDHDGRPRRDRL